MDQVAGAAGISRKSLFLYFPSKGDLLWHRDGQYVEAMRNDLASASGGAGDPVAAMKQAVLAGLRKEMASVESMRLRIALHAEDPQAREVIEAQGVNWRAITAAHFRAAGVGALIADVIAYGYWRALWQALETWAARGDGDLLSDVGAALDRFGAVAKKLDAVGE